MRGPGGPHLGADLWLGRTFEGFDQEISSANQVLCRKFADKFQPGKSLINFFFFFEKGKVKK